jgi:hypothetical protein
MEDKIFDIVTDLIRDDITKDEAINKLLVLHDVIGSYSIPENPTITETGRTYWHNNELQKVFMKDIDGKVYDITKK